MGIFGSNNEKTQKELKYIEDPSTIENSSTIEDDIKSIIYFCENFKLNNNNSEDDFEVAFKKKYEDFKNNISRQENLNYLKEMGIYDFEKKGIDIEFFNLFNNQNEAIKFLQSKTHENLEIIKDKLIYIDNAVKSNDIDEVDNCIDFFNNVLLNCKNKYDLIGKIKTINENLINNFKKFIYIFPCLVELDKNSDNSYNLYNKAKTFFSNASYYISLNKEEYCYIYPEKNKETFIDLNAIKSIKNKINIPYEVEIKLKENKELLEYKEGVLVDKRLFLLNYKEVITNIEIIEQFISFFQKKGCIIPIEIDIKIKYPEITYYLNKNKISNKELLNYLLNVKKYHEKALDLNYKNQQYLRFLYGKQFDTFSRHISGSFEIPSFLRYILNNMNDDIIIKEGIKKFARSTQNYVEEYKYYIDDSFKIYNNYISSVIKGNGISIEDLYEKMKIKYDTNDGNIYKGIYLYKSYSNHMEEDILKIFIEKTRNIPIAQNILIGNKETSFDEIQAFFHRAFLCRFNTLFAIEINDSLSDIQLKIMNNFIDKLLKFQLDKYNKENNTKIDITETSEYIEPLILFVYDENKLNESFLNEINKFKPRDYYYIRRGKISLDENVSNSFSQSFEEKVEYQLNPILLKNTHIYLSEFCGLGKTAKIKFLIQENMNDYFHLSLGGKLSKNIIFKKVEKILNKVKDVKKTSIHLDLYETKDISILNEFLFSFCFTKFYSNDKNVLYILVNINIYIEIPNCFNNFIENYPILNYFEINIINFNNKEKIRLNNEEIKLFKLMMASIEKEGKRINQTPEDFIDSNIGSKKYSYYQINIFIKLFKLLLHQHILENKKIRYLEIDKDVTRERIKEYARSIKYFTQCLYAKLLTNALDEEGAIMINEDETKISKDMNTRDVNCFSGGGVGFELDSEMKIEGMCESGADGEINGDVGLGEIVKEPMMNQSGRVERKFNFINLFSTLYDSDLNREQYEIPLIFVLKNSDFYKKIYLSREKLKEKSENDFLEDIKDILQLINPITTNEGSNLKSLVDIIHQDNYVITADNFRKMILIIYRILADIPVIIMGETGCGKTGLIRKLYQLINNGEEMDKDKNMISIDSSIDDEILIAKMEYINREANKTNKDFWVLFDEINTCNSLGLINEIFINRTYYGKEISKNIRLIGTCNPYRLKTDKEENSGLSHPYKSKNLAYDVNILPHSLMYFVFNFGSLQDEDESRYIESILINHFKNNKYYEIELIIILKAIIRKCHKYFRDIYGASSVSLRDVQRYNKLYDNLMIYFRNKEDENLENNNDNKTIKSKDNKVLKIGSQKGKLNHIKSLIIAIYLNYYIRLINDKKRKIFEFEIHYNLINLANYYSDKENEENDNLNKKENKTIEDNKRNDKKKKFTNPLCINWKPLINEYIKIRSDNKYRFYIFFENECDYIVDNINLDKGIAKNRILKENIFVQFISIVSNIPLIIIGKPGSSKSLSSQQLKKSMRGRYSKSNFLKKYPPVLSTYFQGSESTLAKDIDNLFEIGKEQLKKYENNKENNPISLLIFDGLGLSEFAKDNPVGVLNKNLEYDRVKDGLSFVGFSNWKLDSNKLNRALYLSVPDFDSYFDDLKGTAKCIAKSIGNNSVLNSY